MELSPQLSARFETLQNAYPVKRSALIPMLNATTLSGTRPPPRSPARPHVNPASDDRGRTQLR